MLQVTSEIGKLRTALVHEPGPEVDRMVPAMMEQLLFDDILYGDGARDEHGQFRRVMQLADVEVLEAGDLLAETLEIDEARAAALDTLRKELPPELFERVAGHDSKELARLLVRGIRTDGPATGKGALLYHLAPLPNWCFQRDPQVVLGGSVLFCAMAAPARRREPLLNRLIFKHHPRFSNSAILLDLFDEAERFNGSGSAPCIEGGDILIPSADVIVAGLSERTNRAGLDRLVAELHASESSPRWLLLAHLPRRRAYMHLDTVLTPIDRDACLAYPPVVRSDGREAVEVFEIDLHADTATAVACDGLLEALARRGVDLEPVHCGGEDPVSQQREQWTDGANAIALAPGLITLYDRNMATAEALDRRGFRVVTAEDVLMGREELHDVHRRVCVLLSSHEMSRARGGPHCLVHPLHRAAVD